MGKDYYGILGVSRDASEADLKKAYRKLAMKWHPDKNQGNREQAEAKFKEVSEAFEVLTDPQKRRVYDQFGEDGLKGGGPSPPSGHGAQSGFPGGATFRPRAAEEIFAEFFQSSGGGSPLDAFFGGGMGGMHGMSSMGGMPGMSSMHSSMGGMPGMGMQHGPEALTKPLPCTLEDLYVGRKRKMKISRTVVDGASNRQMQVEEILSIDVKPGWKSGTKVTFPGKGNESPRSPAADVVFVIQELPHKKFARDGSDLVYSHSLPLRDALCGTDLSIPHLDGSTVSARVPGPIAPTTTHTIRGKGMPVSKSPGAFGDLRIKFDIAFPRQLTDKQKTQLKTIL